MNDNYLGPERGQIVHRDESQRRRDVPQRPPDSPFPLDRHLQAQLRRENVHHSPHHYGSESCLFFCILLDGLIQLLFKKRTPEPRRSTLWDSNALPLLPAAIFGATLSSNGYSSLLAHRLKFRPSSPAEVSSREDPKSGIRDESNENWPKMSSLPRRKPEAGLPVRNEKLTPPGDRLRSRSAISTKTRRNATTTCRSTTTDAIDPSNETPPDRGGTI